MPQRAWERTKPLLVDPEREGLLDAWRRGEIPEDVLRRLGVPRYEEWQRQQAAPEVVPPPTPPVSPPEPPGEPSLWERLGQAGRQAGEEVMGEKPWHAARWAIPGYGFQKAAGPVIESAYEHVFRPASTALTEARWMPYATEEERKIIEETPFLERGKEHMAVKEAVRQRWEKEGGEKYIELPWKGGVPGQKARLGESGLYTELAALPLWVAGGAGGKAGQAERVVAKIIAEGGSRKAITEALTKTGFKGDVGKLIVDVSKKVNEQLARKAPKAAEAIPPRVPPAVGAIPPTAPGVAKPPTVPPGAPRPPAPPVTPPMAAAMPPTESALDKFRRVLGEAKPLGPESEAMIAAERKRRLAAGIGAKEAAGGGEKGLYAFLSKQKGAMERPEFEAVRGKFTPNEIDDLIRMPDNFLKPDGKPLREWENVTTKQAFLKLMEGKIPEPKELEWLEKVYGEEIVTAIVKHIKTGAWTKILDVLGIPRAIQTSLDLSYWLRQGGPLALRHPKRAIENLGQGAKSFVTEKNAQALDEAVRTNRWYELATSIERPAEGRLFLPGWGSKEMKLAQRQEEFMTSAFGKRFAKFLGLAQSERAFVTGLNKMKMDEFAYLMEKGQQLGLNTEQMAGPMSRYLNILTGRGDLGRQLNSVAPILNQMFYSARLQVSRLQMAPLLVKTAIKGIKSPEEAFLAKEMAKTLAAWFGLTGAFLGAGVVVGGGKVELDPRSTDAGKLRIGNTRIDPWGGYQQWFRFFTQLITGTRKETATGGLKEINRGELVERFMRGKASPQMGFLMDLLFDQTVIGEEMTASWEGVGQQLRNRLLAFTIMDILDAVEQEGLIGGLYAAPSLFGYGVISYADPLIEREGRLGEVDEEGNFYSLSTFGGDVNRYSGVAGEKGTPLVRFYFESSKAWDKYYDLPIGDARDKFRMNNPRTEAMMYFWGKFTVMQNPKSEKYLKEFIDKHGVHESWVRGLRKETEAPTTTPTPGRKRAWDTEPSAPTGERKRAWD